MEDKIQAFRQPMVTATGIILGFILNFAATFVKSDSQMSTLLAYAITLCIVAGVICLILALNRVLRMDYKREQAEKYYNLTLTYFIFGVSVSFIGVFLDMCSSFLSE